VGAARVLVVEDELEIQQLIALHLRRQGFEVQEVADGDAARHQLSKNTFDLVVLDWMLPGLSGLEITRWIRSQSQLVSLPILFVTAKVEPEYIATGLDAGADDYVGKPFDTLVLMARVNALLRRKTWLEKTPAPEDGLVKVGDLSLNPESYECVLSGEKLDLTRSEFRLLETLMCNQGRVLSRESLIGEVQGEGVNVVGRTVDTHVFGLRKKLNQYANMIETIRGVGYRVKYMSPTP
jgi:two-component system, OmpR family, phosphate regulon response regulator PhoB